MKTVNWIEYTSTMINSTISIAKKAQNECRTQKDTYKILQSLNLLQKAKLVLNVGEVDISGSTQDLLNMLLDIQAKTYEAEGLCLKAKELAPDEEESTMFIRLFFHLHDAMLLTVKLVKEVEKALENEDTLS